MTTLLRRSVLAGGGALLVFPAAVAAAGDDGGVRAPVAVQRNQVLVGVELDGRGPYRLWERTPALDVFNAGVTGVSRGRLALKELI